MCFHLFIQVFSDSTSAIPFSVEEINIVKKNLSLVRGESHSVSLTTVAKQLTFVIPFLSHLVSRFQPSAFRVKPSNPFKYKYSSSPQEASLPTLSCWFICVWCLIAARGHRQARVIVTNRFYSLIFKDRVDNIQQ